MDLPYFHGMISREEAERLVGRLDGTFLLRQSARSPGSYAITLAFEGKCFHYSINPKTEISGQVYSIQNGSCFRTLAELCNHYMQSKGGLKTKLVTPVMKAVPTRQSVSRAEDDSIYETEVDWFHNDISREEDSKRLSSGYRKIRRDGLFLIRKKDDQKYVLSLVSGGRVYRYIILYDAAYHMYYISGKHKFTSLDEFVQFHSTSSTSQTGIQTQLTVACPKPEVQSGSIVPTPVPSVKPKRMNGPGGISQKLVDKLPKDVVNTIWDVQATDSSPMHGKLLSLKKKRKWLQDYMEKYTSAEQQASLKSIYWNFSRDGVLPDLMVDKSNLKTYEQLGKGHFGKVCLGCCTIQGEEKACAIKFLTGEDVLSNKKQLLAEAMLMQKLDHPHIIRLLGVCESQKEIMMLLELAPVGPLNKFLLGKDEKSFSENQIVNIMAQVCYGMRYLEGQNIVHRDLAARNILLVTEDFAKVSDFGMSKVLMESENYYRSSQPGSWPLRWYSPEALNYYKFTTKCDVWSFGVTLWEAFSYGGRPYKGLKGHQILQMIENGERLECPILCPPNFYDIMLYCWTYDEEERPSFAAIADIIINLTDCPP